MSNVIDCNYFDMNFEIDHTTINVTFQHWDTRPNNAYVAEASDGTVYISDSIDDIVTYFEKRNTAFLEEYAENMYQNTM
jgi:hypothetical protein